MQLVEVFFKENSIKIEIFEILNHFNSLNNQIHFLIFWIEKYFMFLNKVTERFFRNRIKIAKSYYAITHIGLKKIRFLLDRLTKY